jgi:hypothetical protein
MQGGRLFASLTLASLGCRAVVRKSSSLKNFMEDSHHGSGTFCGPKSAVHLPASPQWDAVRRKLADRMEVVLLLTVLEVVSLTT